MGGCAAPAAADFPGRHHKEISIQFLEDALMVLQAAQWQKLPDQRADDAPIRSRVLRRGKGKQTADSA
ncbi:hypothetical protein PLESTF_000298500 [Pleodorina starrii]|nr:hypothetical protein PLESTF_000298500 [Pleodorina starrii]